MKLNFFREPDHRPGARVRMVFGGVGNVLMLVLAFVVPGQRLIAILLGFIFLHYLCAGLAESLPRQQTRAAGVLRMLALASSVAGLISALVVLVNL
jgi:hypothetical protein